MGVVGEVGVGDLLASYAASTAKRFSWDRGDPSRTELGLLGSLRDSYAARAAYRSAWDIVPPSWAALSAS